MDGFLILLVLGAPVCIILLVWRPQWGIIALFGLFPIIGILPDLPLITRMASLVGGAALVGAVMHMALRNAFWSTSKSQVFMLLTGLCFILWMTATHPYEAWQGGDRNWVFTYVQLWVLLWLGGRLMRNPTHQRTLMVFFAAASVTVAINGLMYASLATTRVESISIEGANTVARYFVIASIFLFYLQSIERRKLWRWGMWGSIVILVLGVAYTLSRAGIALLVLAAGLLGLRILKEGRSRNLLYMAAAAVVLILLLPSEFWIALQSTLIGTEYNTGGPRAHLSSVQENIRLLLWEAGFQMWLDNPIRGIGIGQFTGQVGSYLPPALSDMQIGAHNMYVQVLVETGIVGLVLFVTLLGQAGRLLYKASKREGPSINVAYIWFVAFVVLAIGGLLKHDHYDKMLWLFLGVSMTFSLIPRTKRGPGRQGGHDPRQSRAVVDAGAVSH